MSGVVWQYRGPVYGPMVMAFAPLLAGGAAAAGGAGLTGALAAGALASTAFGSLTQGLGAQEQAQAQKQAAAYQAQVARYNSQVAEQNAGYALQAGEAQAQQSLAKTSQTIATERAVGAASGFDVNTGTEMNLQSGTSMVGALDAATIRNQAQQQAASYKAQAQGFTMQGALDTATAANAPIAGRINMASSLLSGASSVGAKWLQFQQEGINPLNINQ